MFNRIVPQPLRQIWQSLFPANAAHHNSEIIRLYWRIGYPLSIPQDIFASLAAGRRLPPGYRYRPFRIDKKDGSLREILAPSTALKAAQRGIITKYLNSIVPHPAALGFRRGKSIADHAWTHAGANVIITADIEDFFPSTRRDRVLAWWLEQVDEELDARVLTALTTYRGALPQGAPTSPVLSNLVNAGMDAALERRARQCGGRYSRYGDDLAFSWPDGSIAPSDFQNGVRSVLQQAGYRLHPVKGWHVWYPRERGQGPASITGVVMTRSGGVEIPDSMKRLMRELSRSRDADDRARLAGYEGYRQMIERR